MTDLIFLDTETTGLDIDKHDVWELAYAINDGPIETHILPHTLKSADPKALELNGYFERHPFGARAANAMVDLRLREVFEGKTVVGANVGFDMARLARRWGTEPWHYRPVDIESMAMLAFGLDRPKGQKWIADTLREQGFEIPEPDHTAAGDVACLRACYLALRMARVML